MSYTAACAQAHTIYLGHLRNIYPVHRERSQQPRESLCLCNRVIQVKQLDVCYIYTFIVSCSFCFGEVFHPLFKLHQASNDDSFSVQRLISYRSQRYV